MLIAPAFDLLSEGVDALVEVQTAVSNALASGRDSDKKLASTDAKKADEVAGGEAKHEDKKACKDTSSVVDISGKDSNYTVVHHTEVSSKSGTAAGSDIKRSVASTKAESAEVCLLWSMSAFGVAISSLLAVMALLNDCSCTC